MHALPTPGWGLGIYLVIFVSVTGQDASLHLSVRCHRGDKCEVVSTLREYAVELRELPMFPKQRVPCTHKVTLWELFTLSLVTGKRRNERQRKLWAREGHLAWPWVQFEGMVRFAYMGRLMVLPCSLVEISVPDGRFLLEPHWWWQDRLELGVVQIFMECLQCLVPAIQ